MESQQAPEPSTVAPEMHNKHRRAITMAIILFVLLVVAMFAFTFMKQKELRDDVLVQDEPEQVDARYDGITRIDGKHFFVDGVHTVVGEVVMPTPCDLLEVDAIVAESFPEQITLDFSVINNAEACAQAVTGQRFMVETQASEEASFSALFQNRAIDLNLTPALPGETPDEFELFQKG